MLALTQLKHLQKLQVMGHSTLDFGQLSAQEIQKLQQLKNLSSLSLGVVAAEAFQVTLVTYSPEYSIISSPTCSDRHLSFPPQGSCSPKCHQTTKILRASILCAYFAMPQLEMTHCQVSRELLLKLVATYQNVTTNYEALGELSDGLLQQSLCISLQALPLLSKLTSLDLHGDTWERTLLNLKDIGFLQHLTDLRHLGLHHYELEGGIKDFTGGALHLRAHCGR